VITSAQIRNDPDLGEGQPLQALINQDCSATNASSNARGWRFAEQGRGIYAAKKGK
jgi:hypothetical protein